MTDNELLLAISNMIEPMREDIREIKGRVRIVESKVENIENKVKLIELAQENEVISRLKTIESCYTSTFNRYKDSVEDYEIMKQDIAVIKKVVSEHSEKLQKIS